MGERTIDKFGEVWHHTGHCGAVTVELGADGKRRALNADEPALVKRLAR